MAENFAREVLKVSLAQTCQNLGWNAVHTTPLEILVDILHRYLKTIARTAHTVAEHYNRTEPNLNDLGLTFKKLGISLSELEEYVNNVEPVPFAHPMPKFPVERRDHLHFTNEGCRDVVQRPEWIPPHLLPVHPETDDEDVLPSSSDAVDSKPQVDVTVGFTGDTVSPADSPRPSGRRPLEVTHDTNFSTPKRPRLNSDDEVRPVREVVSVMMTAAGIISPVLEGRLPDACIPPKGFGDSRPTTPVTAPMSPCSPLPSPPVNEEPADVVPKVEETPKIKKGSKVKELKKPRKENKENKKKKALKKGVVPKVKIPVKKSLKTKGSKSGSTLSKKALESKLKKLQKKSPKVKPPKVKVPKVKSPKVKTKKSVGKTTEEGPLDLSKTPPKQTKKGPKGPKAKTKSPKAEKQVPGGQLASLLAKVSGIKAEKGSDLARASQSVVSPRDKDVALMKGEWPEYHPSAENSPDHLIIDDHSDFGEFQQQKEVRLAAVDACINAVIRRGLHRSGSSSSGSVPSSHSRSDLDGLSSVPAKIKLEPRDVYDFTDDDDDVEGDHSKEESIPSEAPPPPPPSAPAVVRSPHKKKDEDKASKSKEKSGKSKENKKSKSKVKDSDKRSKSKSKTKSPKYSKAELELFSEFDMLPPKTPEVDCRDSDSVERSRPVSAVGGSNFQGAAPLSSSMPFHPLSQIPPALLPFPMMPYPGPAPSAAGGCATSPRSHIPYPKLVDLADVAISKAWHDGDFDVGGRSKDKDREKDRKKEKRDKKDRAKEKKKKKDKSKERGSEKDRDKAKSKKLKAVRTKSSKERKEEKSKEKAKKRDKEKEKAKEKKTDKKLEKKKSKDKGNKKEKVEKSNEDAESGKISPSSSAIPRLTFKLGSGSSAEGPKIVIKNLSVDSPSCSPVPPKEPSPPPRPVTPPSPVTHTSSGRSHPKPQSKVQPVPPAPARTVITETVGTIIDDSGNKIWICPACTHPDDGSPMIGCDECDEWYHWICVNIVVPPKEEEEWYCTRCVARKQNTQKPAVQPDSDVQPRKPRTRSRHKLHITNFVCS